MGKTIAQGVMVGMIQIECSLCGMGIDAEQVEITWRGYAAHAICSYYDDMADEMEMESIRKAEIRNEQALYGDAHGHEFWIG